MTLYLQRFLDSGTFTLGLIKIGTKFECFTLEDEHRDIKVPGETCIPVGEYEIELRTVGTHHTRYLEKFPGVHIGMLHLKNVPNFKYILIHIGNTKRDTEGCILVGNQSVKSGKIVDSTTAYLELYKKVAPAIKRGERVTIKIYEA